MAGNRHRRAATAVDNTAGEQKGFEKGETGDDPVTIPDSPGSDSDSELATLRLRERWELASVLNFLNVFEPIIGSDLKMSAEEIEMGLIKPDSSLVKLHITLLKGIPPVSKKLNDSWVPALCKILALWWPWVAEGEIPLSAAKGEETSGYKELDPTTRLLILKALCEIRADQDDTASYINDALKSGTEIPCFRKDKIGGDGNGTTYWYDGNTITGYRLYKEVKKFESKTKLKGKDCLTLPGFSFQWETLATNLEEFRKVVDEFSSSKVWGELAVGKTIEVDVIPILEKIQKKKEMAMKRKQNQERLLNSYQNSYATGITRSCRIRKPVNYTYDEYDRAIDEAIHGTKKRKKDNEQKHEEKLNESGEKNGKASIGSLELDTHSGEGSVEKHASMENGSYNNEVRGNDDDDDEGDDEYIEKEDDDNDDESESSHSEKENNSLGNGNLHPQKQKGYDALESIGSRWSMRLAGANGNPVAEARNIVTKNRSRQRPTRNTAIESSVVPDSEDEGSENTVSDISGEEDTGSDRSGEEETLSQDTDKEENNDS